MQENIENLTTTNDQSEIAAENPTLTGDAEEVEEIFVPSNYEEELREVNGSISYHKTSLAQEKQTARRYAIAAFMLLLIPIWFIYWSWPHWSDYSSNPDGPYSWLINAAIIGGMIWFVAFGLVTMPVVVQQWSINYHKTQMEMAKSRQELIKQFAEAQNKPSYFDILVRINTENSKEYYRLPKTQVQQSFRLVVSISIVGFLLLIIGLIVGFVDFEKFNALSFLTSGAGIITEFVSSIFFALYNKTLQQMQTYHNDLSSKGNILLSFKLIESVQDPKARSELIEQVLPHFFEAQNTLKTNNTESK